MIFNSTIAGSGGGGGNANRTLIAENVAMGYYGGSGDSLSCYGIPYNFPAGSKTYDLTMVVSGAFLDAVSEPILSIGFDGENFLEIRGTVKVTENNGFYSVETSVACIEGNYYTESVPFMYVMNYSILGVG